MLPKTPKTTSVSGTPHIETESAVANGRASATDPHEIARRAPDLPDLADPPRHPERQKLFEAIRLARAQIKGYKFAELKPTTVADYARREQSLMDQIAHSVPGGGFTALEIFFLAHARVPRTFFKYKSVVRRRLVKEVKSRLIVQDKYQKVGIWDVWLEQVERLVQALTTLQELEALDRLDLLQRGGRSTAASRSKRDDIDALPADWRQQVLDAVHPQFELAVLILSVTGCRASEVNGSSLNIQGDLVRISIQGSKQTDSNGQPLREFAVPIHQFPEHWIEQLRSHSELKLQALATESERRRLRGHLDRIGGKLFSEHPGKISAILFRHDMASTLRESGFDQEEIGGVLGHASQSTQRHYGSRKKRKGNRPKAMVEKGSIQTARPIRKGKTSPFLSESPPKLQRNKKTTAKAIAGSKRGSAGASLS